MSGSLRVAILAHSTNPRGGVVHALALGDALTGLGHTAVVHAPDPKQLGFFRRTSCETAAVRAVPLPSADTFTLVQTRVADYVRHFELPDHRRFDVYHAQDGISGNALATLKQRGLIDAFARTIHHVDTFLDPRLEALQRRSIVAADARFVVSPLWQETLDDEFGLTSTQVGNGVDLQRFSARAEPGDLVLRRRFKLNSGPVFLSVGGVEERKNTLRALEAFAQVFRLHPGAQLVLAGGSSLLDHTAYRARFAEVREASGLPAHAVVETGAVADVDMPGLYRNADALVFPSTREGFGLVVLEAMASALPVVLSAIRPFTDYLGPEDALWCKPEHASSIAEAMVLALSPGRRRTLAGRGAAIAARHDWRETARAHLPVYASVGAMQHA